MAIPLTRRNQLERRLTSLERQAGILRETAYQRWLPTISDDDLELLSRTAEAAHASGCAQVLPGDVPAFERLHANLQEFVENAG